MNNQGFDLGQFLIYGFFGAFLGAIIALGVQFMWFEIDWIFVGVIAAVGFVVGGIGGEDGIEFLKTVFRLWLS